MINKFSEEIKKARIEATPRPEWVEERRSILLSQISLQATDTLSISPLTYVAAVFDAFRYRTMQPAVVMLGVLVTFLVSSFTVNAAYYSLPGDNLYSVKIALEKTHVAMVANEEKKVDLKIEFAQKRIEEFEKIVRQPEQNPEVQKKKVEAVVKQFKENVVAVNQEVNKIKKTAETATAQDMNSEASERTVLMALTISQKTQQLATTLDEKSEELSGEQKLSIELENVVEEAVKSAQDVSESAKQIVDQANKEIENTEPSQDQKTDESDVTATTTSKVNTQTTETATSTDTVTSASSTVETQQ